MRLIVEIDRTPDGRIEGRIRPDAAQPWRPFSGVLELLKELQDGLDVPDVLDVLDPAQIALPPHDDIKETT
jgi:hypothetical protein